MMRQHCFDRNLRKRTIYSDHNLHPVTYFENTEVIGVNSTQSSFLLPLRNLDTY